MADQAHPASPYAAVDRLPRARVGRRIAIVAAIVLIVAFGLHAWHKRHKRPASGAAAPPTTVGMATAVVSDVPVFLDALGTVTPSATVTVTPQVSGVLTRVAFSEGQIVKTGQLIATVDPRPFDLALLQAQGGQRKDAASLDAANVTLARYLTLLRQDSIARQDVDTQAALVKQLEGTLVADRAAVGTARLNQEWARITAPVSGRIGLRGVDVGNLVTPNTAGGIAAITELAPIDVEFSVPQDRIPQLQGRIASGARLAVTASDGARTKTLDTGVFLSLNNQSDTQTGTVRAKARFANAGNTLFPSQFVNVRLRVDTLKDAVVVPVTALRHGPKGDFVYVLVERTVTIRPVIDGPSTADRMVIDSGLRAGERVVTEGADRLRDGAHVRLPGDAASAPADPAASR